MNEEQLIEHINETRQSNGLSYESVGNLCGMTKQNVWRILNGKTSPMLCNVYKVAKACGVDRLDIKL